MTDRALFWRRLALVLALEAASVLLYARSVRYEPVWDDHEFVQAQLFLKRPANLAKVLAPRSLRKVLRVRGAARPVWLASVLLDEALARGASFAAHKVSNALWHGWSAAALVALGAALGAGPPACLAAAALFLVHPAHAEVVELVTFRSDLLALFFLALSLACYARARAERGAARAGGLAACLGLLALALLSKETAAVAPLLALALDAAFPAEGWGRAWRAGCFAAMTALVVLYLGFRGPRSGYDTGGRGDTFTRLMAQHPSWFQPFTEEHLTMPEGAGPGRRRHEVWPWLGPYYGDPVIRARTALQLVVDEARLLVWPARLVGDYDPRPAKGWLDARVAAGAALALAAAAGAWLLRRREPLAALGLAWTLIALLPTSGVLQLPNLLAERYLLLPSAGLALAAGALFARAWAAPARRPWAAAALGVLLLAGAARTVAREGDFASDRAYHEAAVRADPESLPAHQFLGWALAAEGDQKGADAEFAFVESRLAR